MKSKAHRYIVFLVVAVAAVFALYMLKGAIVAQMDQWKLIPRPERFTELYFNDHVNLPKHISNGEKISFAFVIHNLEGESREYPYSVYFKSLDGQVIPIAEGTETLADGVYKTIEHSYTSGLSENKGGVFVELKEKQQGIHFLLNNNN